MKDVSKVLEAGDFESVLKHLEHLKEQEYMVYQQVWALRSPECWDYYKARNARLVEITMLRQSASKLRRAWRNRIEVFYRGSTKDSSERGRTGSADQEGTDRDVEK